MWEKLETSVVNFRLPQSNPLNTSNGRDAEVVLIENSDWSGRHVRLKYQMVISSLLFYLYETTTVTEINFLGMMKLSQSAMQEKTFFMMLFGFAIFSALAFITRSIYEKSKWSSLRKDVSDLILKIRITEGEAITLLKENKKLNFAKRLDNLIEGPNDEYSEEVDEAVSGLHEAQQRGVINQLYYAINSIGRDATNLEACLKAIRAGYQPTVSQYKVPYNACSSSSSAISSSVDNIVRAIREDRNTSEMKIGRVKTSLVNYFDNIVKLENSLSKLEPISRELKKSEGRRNFLYNTQNLMFSVFIPLITSAVLIFVALYHKRLM